jgi:uncharacterized protein with GYD domain
MKAVILLRTNPGAEQTSYGRIESISAPGVRVTETLHVFGRADGVVICEADDLKALGGLGEALRSDGVFHTETLISMQD